LTPKDVSAIRHDEANKYFAVFLAELPNEGRYVARVIRSRVLGLKPPAPLWYWDKGDLAVVGRTYAVADIRFLRFAGIPAWGWFGQSSTFTF
jgi:NADH dehydrogenase FAD-containing subunit